MNANKLAENAINGLEKDVNNLEHRLKVCDYINEHHKAELERILGGLKVKLSELKREV